MDYEIIPLEKFRQLKYIKEELIDILSFITDFINNSTEKQKSVFYESVIRHKVDRVCYYIPNFILSSDVFELVEKIFMKLIDIKEKKIAKNEELKRINEMYGRFKYLIEWCLLYYEETYISN